MNLIHGVYAAILTPRDPDGAINVASLGKLIAYPLARGARGVVLNGATGEFPITTVNELKHALDVANDVIESDAEVLCGIGSASVRGCLEAGRVALEAGARAVLLPTPYFYRYEQDDLEAFVHAVSKQLDVPILLYNLPQFSNGLDPATVRRLIDSCPNVIGIKDSGGSLDILRDLTDAGTDACRIVGSDNVLGQALREGVCDGIISGVAGVLPELVLPLYENRAIPDSPEFRRDEETLGAFIEQLDRFPAPWALKWIAEARGVASARFAQPLSTRRMNQKRELLSWLSERQALA